MPFVLPTPVRMATLPARRPVPLAVLKWFWIDARRSSVRAWAAMRAGDGAGGAMLTL